MLEIQFDRHSCQLHLYAISRIFHTTKPVEESCILQYSDERLTAQRCGWSYSYLQRAKTLHVLKNLIYLSGTHHNGFLWWLHKKTPVQTGAQTDSMPSSKKNES